ncbi:MAG: hypothetical protein Q9217_000893 [Psora testacea]
MASGKTPTPQDPQILKDGASDLAAIFAPNEAINALLLPLETLVSNELMVHEERYNKQFEQWECKNLLEKPKVMEDLIAEYHKSYHPKLTPKQQIFGRDEGIASTIFQRHDIKLRTAPQVIMFRESHLTNTEPSIKVMMPLYKEGEVKITVKMANGNPIEVEWIPGSFMVSSEMSRFDFSGPGRVVFILLGLAY